MIINIFILLSSCSRVDKSNFSKQKEILYDSNKYSNLNTDVEVIVIDTLEILKANLQHGDYHFLLSDSLTIEDLVYLPPSILRLMRNEIFAKKGYIFSSDDLQQHFKSLDWYVPLFRNVDSLLSLVDKHNIAVIQAAEKENKEISRSELFEIYLSYVDNSPRGICYLFDCSKMRTDYSEEYMGGFVKEHVLESSEKYKYLISGWFGGCSNCNYQYHLEKYDLEGNYLNEIDFGISYEFEAKISYYPDSLIIETYDRELKKKYSDSAAHIVELEEDLYEDVSRYYNYNSITIRVLLDDGDNIKLEESTTGNNV